VDLYIRSPIRLHGVLFSSGVDSALNRNEYHKSSGSKGLPVRKADNFTAICEPIVLENVGASTSHSCITSDEEQILNLKCSKDLKSNVYVTRLITKEELNVYFCLLESDNSVGTDISF
jgi:hypothetical protein